MESPNVVAVTSKFVMDAELQTASTPTMALYGQRPRIRVTKIGGRAPWKTL